MSKQCSSCGGFCGATCERASLSADFVKRQIDTEKLRLENDIDDRFAGRLAFIAGAEWQARAALSAATDAEQNRLDAERYRWLRNVATAEDWKNIGYYLLGEEADNFIDAAIAQAKPATFEYGGVTVINTGAKV